jgi:hypothetical protein
LHWHRSDQKPQQQCLEDTNHLISLARVKLPKATLYCAVYVFPQWEDQVLFLRCSVWAHIRHEAPVSETGWQK